MSQDDSFETLLKESAGIVRRVARSFARDAEVRDLEQEILLRLWESRGQRDHSRPAVPWIYRVALNVGLNWQRASRRRRAGDAAFEEHARKQPTETKGLEALYEELRALEGIDRSIALMSLDGHKHRDIASTLGLTETNVAVRMHRLRKELRRRLDGRI